MLSNPEMFKNVENTLRGQESFNEWIQENGEITGRMMIEKVDLPDGIEIKHPREYAPVAFEASFDFYDVMIGIAVFAETKDFASSLWMHYQDEDASLPDHTWITFFLDKLLESIHDDGTFGYPIYSLVNDTSDITVIPELPQ